MKIISAIAAALSVGFANARIISSSDAYYWKREPLGSTMWIFNEDGLKVYSNNGMEVKREVGTDVGLEATSGGRLSFYEVQSDGHKYVWVASGARVEVFDIDTGDYAGYVPSCGNPAMELRYLPTRQEMWLRCARGTDDESGNIDVFSTNSLSTNHEGISFPGTFNYGWGLEVHSTLGNSGYAAPYNADYLYEIDLSSKEIIANYTFPDEVFTTYDLTYSPTNKHIYGKARVCCSCGFDGADLDTCGNVGQVVVKTGPTASPNLQNGTCGGGCEGTPADTIGVFEFDTVSKTYAGSHNGVAGNGATAMASPDGKYIVLATHDAGETVRVLKAGINGVPATVAADIPVAFGGNPGSETVGDVAFIEDENRNFMIIAGWGNNEVAVVDLDDDFRMVKIMLTDNPEPTAAGQRNVEWAVGSNYVWIDGPQASEIYVVEIGATIDSTKVSNVIESKGGLIIHVDNHERAAVAEIMMKAGLQNTMDDDDDDSTRAIAVSGLILGCIALLWAVALTVFKATGAPSSGAATEEQAPGADFVTLGSKQAV